MKVEFIYDPDCPNVAEARAQLLRAFTETGISPRWAEWSRDSAEAPAYARGFGSPTLLVNGHDVAEQTSAHGNACCRLYADPSGALRGAPSVEQIVAALQARRLAGPTQRQLPLALPALLVSLLPNLTCPACWPAYGAVLAALGLGFVSTGVWLLPLTIVSLRCAVGLRRCGCRAPWLWPARHWPRCSICVGYRQVFPELQHALDCRTRSADICIFLECVAARPQTRVCCLRAGRKPREPFAS